MTKTLLNLPKFEGGGRSEARSKEISAKFLFTEMWIVAHNIYNDIVSVIVRNIFSAATGFTLSKNNGRLLHVTYKSKIHFPNCKGTTEVEMVGWHHWLDGHEFKQALGVGDGQGGPVCCSPWGHKNRTQLRDWTELDCRCLAKKKKGLWSNMIWLNSLNTARPSNSSRIFS